MHARQRLRHTVGQRQPRSRADREEQRLLPDSVAVGDDAGTRHLHDAGCQVYGRDRRIGLDQGHVRQPGIVAPGRRQLALQGQVTSSIVLYGEQPAAVGRHVEHAVRAAARLAILRVAHDADRRTRQWLPVARQHTPAQHRHALRVDCAGRNAGLDWVAAGVQELRRVIQARGHAGVERRRDSGRVGRDAGLHHDPARERRCAQRIIDDHARYAEHVTERAARRQRRAEGITRRRERVARVWRKRCRRRTASRGGGRAAHHERQVDLIRGAAVQHIRMARGVEPGHRQRCAHGQHGRLKAARRKRDDDCGGSTARLSPLGTRRWFVSKDRKRDGERASQRERTEKRKQIIFAHDEILYMVSALFRPQAHGEQARKRSRPWMGHGGILAQGALAGR